MRFLTDYESTEWCQAHGIQANGAFREPLAEHSVLEFRLPSGDRVGLYRSLWLAAGEEGGERLFYVRDWSIWPSVEHLPLAFRLRQALGETLPLEQKPGCIVLPSESDDGFSLFLVGALFLWECWLFTATGAAIYLCHEERGTVFDPHGRLLNQISANLAALGIEILPRRAP